MQQRNTAIDMAKGISLLTLPAIHSTLFFGNPSVFASPFGLTLAFIAETIGAPVFLMTMGWSISYNAPKSIKNIFLRALNLFVMGYFLNFLKFGIPYFANEIPEALFRENGILHDTSGLFQLLLIGDILQLAAFAYIVCAMVHRSNKKIRDSILAFLILLSLTPIFWHLQGQNSLLVFCISLFNGLPPQTFFPAFPWLLYPLAGQIFGYLGFPESNKKISWLIGVVVLVFGVLFSFFEPKEWESNYYRLGTGGTLYHIGVAFIFLLLCDWVSKLGLTKPFENVFNLLSRNITIVYIIQWVIVCWTLPVFSYHQLNLSQTFFAVTLNTSLTIIISIVYSKTKRLWNKSLIL